MPKRIRRRAHDRRQRRRVPVDGRTEILPGARADAVAGWNSGRRRVRSEREAVAGGWVRVRDVREVLQKGRRKRGRIDSRERVHLLRWIIDELEGRSEEFAGD